MVLLRGGGGDFIAKAPTERLLTLIEMLSNTDVPGLIVTPSRPAPVSLMDNERVQWAIWDRACFGCPRLGRCLVIAINTVCSLPVHRLSKPIVPNRQWRKNFIGALLCVLQNERDALWRAHAYKRIFPC